MWGWGAGCGERQRHAARRTVDAIEHNKTAGGHDAFHFLLVGCLVVIG